MKRTGFTLIELLVVIAILSVLAALSAGAYFRIRASSTVVSTEQTLVQLNTGLERIWSAARDQAEKEFVSGKLPGANNKIDTLINFCGGPSEKDRAKALWLYLRLKNEFPQTFQEAVSDVVLSTSSGADVIRLKPKSTFTAKLPTGATLPAILAANARSNSSNDLSLMPVEDYGILQAAALFYIALTEKGSGGETFSSETSSARTQSIPLNGRNFTVFTDAWGKPLTFVRWLQTSEMNAPPFARHATALNNTDAKSQDPLDVTNKLTNARWTGTNADNARKAIGQLADGSAITMSNTLGWHPTIISAGPNGKWNIPDPDPNPLLPPLEAFDVCFGTSTMKESNVGMVSASLGGNGTDNIYSYRLRQFGARGD